MNTLNYKKIANTIIDDLTSRKIIDYETINDDSVKYVDCFRYITKKDFDTKSKTILKAIDKTTTDIQFTAIMKKIFALFKDSHTIFHGTKHNNQYFDCRFKFFDGKLYVFNENKEYLLIKTINDIPIEKIIKDLTPLISFEVDAWKYLQLEKMLRHSLNYEMINASNGEVLESCEKTHGECVTPVCFEMIKPSAALAHKGETPSRSKLGLRIPTPVLKITGTKNGQPQTQTIGIRESNNKTEKQIEQGRKSKNYYFNFFADGKLYIDYAICENDKNYPMGDLSCKANDETFIGDIKSALGDKAITGVIIDLRKNNGGNQNVITPLIDYLKQFDLNGNNTALLTSAEIISSGLWAAADLKKAFEAKFIGEPLGQCTESYGSNSYRIYDIASNQVIPLSKNPNNKSSVTNQNHGFHYTTTKWYIGKAKSIAGQPPRSEIFPDISIPQTLNDYLNDFDRQLQTAKNYILGVKL